MVQTSSSQIWYEPSAHVPTTTPTRHRSSSAPVKIDAGALLVLAILAKQSRIFASFLKRRLLLICLLGMQKSVQTNRGQLKKSTTHACNASRINIKIKEVFPDAIVIEPEKQNNASPTVLAHAKCG